MWINLAVSRNHLATLAADTLDAWAARPASGSAGFRPALWTHMVGDPALIGRADALVDEALGRWRPASAKHLGFPHVLPEVLGLSILSHARGTDRTEVWESIADAKPFASPVTRALQQLAAALLERPSPARTKRTVPPRGHVPSEREWLALLKTGMHVDLLDLALSPDHWLWPYTLDSFVLPLAWLAGGEGGGAPLRVLSHGPYPERRGTTLFERPFQPSPGPSRYDRQTAPEWPGIDVVEIHGEELRGYFHPFQPAGGDEWLRARLGRMDQCWELTLREMDGASRVRAERAGGGRDAAVFVVYDARECGDAPERIDRVSRETGVPVQAVDVRSA
ncbi:MAG TPA: hypothetical protein VGB24_04445 [Longimicrobium sp.]|jgi:hypothetical protein|uniref:hypothetical protein n=1 Tax=Longimicrobium sp. TaxID=2029185 RepID=UPI002ED8CE20